MPGNVDFRNLDDYEASLKATVGPWEPARRMVLAAAMAERWLPVYERFSSSENWGDPQVLRQTLDRVWEAAQGHAPKVDWKAAGQHVHEITPHLDDFNANEALCACVMVQYAVQACRDKDNLPAVVWGLLTGLEAVSSDLLTGDPVPARQWRQPAIGREIQKQLRLVEAVGGLTGLENARQALKALFSGPEMAGEVQVKTPVAPAGPSNQQAYEQYRKIIEADIKSAGKRMDPKQYPDLAVTLHLASWLGRYSRRKQILSGEYGVLQDQRAIQLLLEKNRMIDRSESSPADWDPGTLERIEIFYRNPHNGMDASNLDSPHGYGPSLRRLWVEARRGGLSPEAAWDAIEAWAAHQPEAWKKGKTGLKAPVLLQAALEQPVAWNFTGDPNLPWQADVVGQRWQVRLNDFPDEVMYSLIINGQVAGDFHDWPINWRRD